MIKIEIFFHADAISFSSKICERVRMKSLNPMVACVRYIMHVIGFVNGYTNWLMMELQKWERSYIALNIT